MATAFACAGACVDEDDKVTAAGDTHEAHGAQMSPIDEAIAMSCGPAFLYVTLSKEAGAVTARRTSPASASARWHYWTAPFCAIAGTRVRASRSLRRVNVEHGAPGRDWTCWTCCLGECADDLTAARRPDGLGGLESPVAQTSGIQCKGRCTLQSPVSHPCSGRRWAGRPCRYSDPVRPSSSRHSGASGGPSPRIPGRSPGRAGRWKQAP